MKTRHITVFQNIILFTQFFCIFNPYVWHTCQEHLYGELNADFACRMVFPVHSSCCSYEFIFFILILINTLHIYEEYIKYTLKSVTCDGEESCIQNDYCT